MPSNYRRVVRSPHRRAVGPPHRRRRVTLQAPSGHRTDARSGHHTDAPSGHATDAPSGHRTGAPWGHVQVHGRVTYRRAVGSRTEGTWLRKRCAQRGGGAGPALGPQLACPGLVSPPVPGSLSVFRSFRLQEGFAGLVSCFLFLFFLVCFSF